MKKKISKVLALFLALNILTTTLAPTLSYALTAGPTAPEYTSFEPVDTTDMVNLATGDFTYNIPLLEVPGPEGGYPLALSYHAGIQPDEEASWVGLGWTLNPGAINRTVDGFPDDVYAAQQIVHDYWPGGNLNVFTVGLGYGGLNVNLDVANDTYKGSSLGLGVEYGWKYSLGNASAGITLGYSSGILGADPGVSLESSIKISTLSIGVSTDFNSISSNGSLGIMGLSANISSNNLKPTMNYFGYSSFQSNNNSGKISSTSDGFRATIPIWYGFTLTLGQQHRRYWSDQTDGMIMYGSLYNRNASSNPANSSLDSYILPDFINADVSADNQKGGSFPAYDMYSVLGQGIGGTIQPYTFQNTNLYRKNVLRNGENVVSFGRTESLSNDLPINFRFKNDFSNSFLISKGGFPTDAVTYGNHLSIPSATKSYNSNYYNDSRNMLAGSRHIEWVTNSDIKNGTFLAKSSFIPHEGASFGTRKISGVGFDISSQIGGFVVTNTSGVSYHYSLPVYAYGEYSKMTSTDGSFKESFNYQPYAYTWLLTAVTGPDYVDRGSFGISDEDLGYWVKFEYGKWTSKYIYRTPIQGTKKDLDEGYNYFSGGKKELYYLDYIKTRTHTAVFEKEIRNDGKGVGSIENGGIAANGLERIPPSNLNSGSSYEILFGISPMKLKNIYLFENDELKTILNESQGTTLSNLKSKGISKYTTGNYYGGSETISTTATGQCTQLAGTFNYICYSYVIDETGPIDHLWNNVIDAYDISTIANFEKKALKVINLKSNYDLCPNTINSVLNNDDFYYFYKVMGYGQGPVGTTVPWPIVNGNPITMYSRGGKLTLNEIEIKGKGGASVMPSTKFHYNYSDASGNYANLSTDNINNPSYNKDKKDIWGNYKPDINLNKLAVNETFARAVTDASANSAHVWSLKEIETPTGAKVKINYESDEYDNVVLGNLSSLPIVATVLLNTYTIKVFVDNQNEDISSLFSDYIMSNKSIRLIGAYKFTSEPAEYNPHDWCQSDENQGIQRMTIWRNFNTEVEISEVGSNYIVCHPKINIDQEGGPKSQDFGRADYIGSTMQGLGFQGKTTCNNHSGDEIYMNYTYKNNGTLVAGNVFFDKLVLKNGGGVRVSSVSMESDQGVFSTNYEYLNGTTSYLPGGYDNNFRHTADINIHDVIIWKNQADSKNKYSGDIARLFKNTLSYARELPGPGVMYGNVKVYETVKEANDVTNATLKIKPGKKEYNFQMFNFDNGTKDVEKNSSLFGTRMNEVTYVDYTSRIGNLTRTIDYDKTGQKLEETVFQYAYDDLDPATLSLTRKPNTEYVTLINSSYKNQGHIEELFNELRFNYTNNEELFIYSKKVEYPAVLKKTVTKNYKTGIVSTTENLEYDFITGAPTKVLSKDAYGNAFMTKTTYAYTLADYKDGMGIKIFNDYVGGTRLGKNMLSQTSGTEVFKVDASNTPIGLVAAQVNTWKMDSYQNTFYGQSGTTAFQATPLWRPFRDYTWIGTETLQSDGTHAIEDYTDDPFSAWLPNQTPATSSYWQKNSEITLYNEHSKALEASDMNGLYAANRMDNDNKFIVASASPSRYAEMTYSGAESFDGNTALDNGVSRGNGTPSTSFAHTGKYSLQVNPGEKGFNYTLNSSQMDLSKKYWASVWVYMPGATENTLADASLYYSINGTEVKANPISTHKAGSKYLITIKIDPNGTTNNIEIGCKNNSSRAIYFDDFRVHPLGASMNTYVYNKSTFELEAILNKDNLYTRFEYDNAGRLVKQYQELFYIAEKKISNMKYNYGK